MLKWNISLNYYFVKGTKDLDQTFINFVKGTKYLSKILAWTIILGCIVCVWIQRFPLNPELHFSIFFFFLFPCTWTVISHRFTVYETKITIHVLFITVHSTVYALKNIKNGSHGTIHTFKNYFATVLSVFSFQFQK